MTATSRANNRSITLTGANKMFEKTGVKIQQSDLGFYWADMRGKRYQAKTLTELCQELIWTLWQ